MWRLFWVMQKRKIYIWWFVYDCELYMLCNIRSPSDLQYVMNITRYFMYLLFIKIQCHFISSHLWFIYFHIVQNQRDCLAISNSTHYEDKKCTALNNGPAFQVSWYIGRSIESLVSWQQWERCFEVKTDGQRLIIWLISKVWHSSFCADPFPAVGAWKRKMRCNDISAGRKKRQWNQWFQLFQRGKLL